MNPKKCLIADYLKEGFKCDGAELILVIMASGRSFNNISKVKLQRMRCSPEITCHERQSPASEVSKVHLSDALAYMICCEVQLCLRLDIVLSPFSGLFQTVLLCLFLHKCTDH